MNGCELGKVRGLPAEKSHPVLQAELKGCRTRFAVAEVGSTKISIAIGWFTAIVRMLDGFRHSSWWDEDAQAAE